MVLRASTPSPVEWEFVENPIVICITSLRLSMNLQDEQAWTKKILITSGSVHEPQ